MAALSSFPPHFLSLSSHYYSQTSTSTSFSFFYHHHHSYFHSNRRFCNGQFSIACLASMPSTKKPRPSRKLMSDEELRNVLREFVASVGLPEGHVPSIKELSHHGRKELANIVRRRGHKLIKELLANSVNIATDGFDTFRNINGESDEHSDYGTTGQGEQLDSTVEEPTDFPMADDDFFTGTRLDKVENFMKYGQLDAVEVEREPVIHNEADTRHLTHERNINVGQNGTLLLPSLTCPPAMEDKFKRDFNSSAQGLQGTDFDNEAGIMDNEAEINHLKHMLRQKEVELSRLKEEIEREKQALSILQTKAEIEISKAQKLLSDKDAELDAAEESLSGLLEAKLQYSGEGELVEVAGSFNGWHQRVKMDPQPSAIVDPVGSRNSKLWSTTLWLYPGVYEIKFVVDGHWKIDPQRESTIKGGVENNILRVDR
ncbi:protein PTST homolog 3, chloroplastic isoform X2 [Spinacia oleracea]|uniref:Protein PTST homolog 3, chloroplastic isoform X2 n=1 Tax=Spinacia oleracea TaxID=3562 RepID=A0A9R0IDV5_SPIOL|nr:protein PTST homolog 3, chloroplastic isoform X2 [Spinacia oleracea]